MSYVEMVVGRASLLKSQEKMLQKDVSGKHTKEKKPKGGHCPLLTLRCFRNGRCGSFIFLFLIFVCLGVLCCVFVVVVCGWVFFCTRTERNRLFLM